MVEWILAWVTAGSATPGLSLGSGRLAGPSGGAAVDGMVGRGAAPVVVVVVLVVVVLLVVVVGAAAVLVEVVDASEVLVVGPVVEATRPAVAGDGVG